MAYNPINVFVVSLHPDIEGPIAVILVPEGSPKALEERLGATYDKKTSKIIFPKEIWRAWPLLSSCGADCEQLLQNCRANRQDPENFRVLRIGELPVALESGEYWLYVRELPLMQLS